MVLLGVSAAPQVKASTASELRDGAPSQRELIDRMLHALKIKDADALRRLRLSESEYREIVIPGHVPPGSPPRRLTDEGSYAWANLSTRSYAFELVLLREFGGHDLTVKDISFAEGEKQYAGYKAYRQLSLTVTEADGTERELRTGSIAEIGGKFKFISFIRD